MDKDQLAKTLRSVPKDRAARIVGGLLLLAAVILLVVPIGYSYYDGVTVSFEDSELARSIRACEGNWNIEIETGPSPADREYCLERFDAVWEPYEDGNSDVMKFVIPPGDKEEAALIDRCRQHDYYSRRTLYEPESHKPCIERYGANWVHVDCGILIHPDTGQGECGNRFNSRLRNTIIVAAVGVALVLGSSQLKRRDQELGEPDSPSDPDRCPHCGNTHSEDARFCDATGSPINAET